MKKLLLTCCLFISAAALHATEEKVYECAFEENVPRSVHAWSQSPRVKSGEGGEHRFLPYRKGDAAELTNDALVDRGAGEAVEGDARKTTFWQAYNAEGWHIYIESKEPLIRDLLNALIDERSPAHKEAYELFFAPGSERVPYYQIFARPYKNETTYFDWGTPGMNYRSLKGATVVESAPLEDGVGTYVFIPWYLLYEHAPLEGDQWRFTLIRWMPFSKAGGVTWGGQVHETGRFGWVRFTPPTAEQRTAIGRRLLQYAWFRFLAASDRLAEYWSDPHLGDPAFHEARLAPEIERLRDLAEPWSEPEKLSAEEVSKAMTQLKPVMEFEYHVSALRTQELRARGFAGK